MRDMHGCAAAIDRALEPLDRAVRDAIRPMVVNLFDLAYPDLEKTLAQNPIEHHLTVLRHMMEIARGEASPCIATDHAAALALLHDLSPVEKITSRMVEDARKESPGRAAALELKRRQCRVLHMREGSAMANRRLLDLNERMGAVVFDERAIDIVCDTIRIHDNPSLDIPLPRSDWLAVAFREADRLWMVTPEGLAADLARRNAADDPEARRRQLISNIERFCEERSLYRPIEAREGPFQDGETFFRTRTGFSIYCRLVERREP